MLNTCKATVEWWTGWDEVLHWDEIPLCYLKQKHAVTERKQKNKHGLYRYMVHSTKYVIPSVCLRTHVTHSWRWTAADELQSDSWQTTRDLRHTDGISALPFIYTHTHTHIHTCKQTHKHTRLPTDYKDRVVHRKHSVIQCWFPPQSPSPLVSSSHLFSNMGGLLFGFSSWHQYPEQSGGSVHPRPQVLWKRRLWEHGRTMAGTGRGKKGSFVTSSGWTSPEGSCFL